MRYGGKYGTPSGYGGKGNGTAPSGNGKGGWYGYGWEGHGSSSGGGSWGPRADERSGGRSSAAVADNGWNGQHGRWDWPERPGGGARTGGRGGWVADALVDRRDGGRGGGAGLRTPPRGSSGSSAHRKLNSEILAMRTR